MKTYTYLHGFASSPQSVKAQQLRESFSAIGVALVIPDLNQGDFFNLTLSRQIQQTRSLLPNDAFVTLIGSSLGGLTAAWVGEQSAQVERLILLAPAFDFLAHWLPRIGSEQLQQWQATRSLQVYHYGEQKMLPLGYTFATDAAQYKDNQLQRSIPTLILHGRQDEVISIEASRNYAAQRPWVKLVELDSDHALGNVQVEIWQAIQDFCPELKTC
ncbi:MAG: alpha/beta fold hydrolase [Oscillatoriophycideae cyanobacterium NC_groundwater_1537_Pr4_S-0.65um_50_18]|nr:alpha/beta fold hydrolase [Oscillatoriophycideae cyanobacterium NC_groundwater_1537_Pr4_S-0.65um_50_18]